MLGKLIIDDVRPRTPNGYPAKAAIGERITVLADILKEGHDFLAARVRWRSSGGKWHSAPMAEINNDRWTVAFEPDQVGDLEFQIEAWTDRYATWRHEVEVKATADLHAPLAAEIEEGARLVERLAKRVGKDDRLILKAAAAGLRDESLSRDQRLNAGLDDRVAQLLDGVDDNLDLTRSARFPLWVDRERARFGAWYELFPRSEGGFEGAAKRLPDIAAMGFDIVYLPPIHPIGRSFRKGKDNSLEAKKHDVGSPWAIGAKGGGHTAIHADLGTEADFKAFVEETRANGMEVALDYALQCSPDHPWVKAHPEWFLHRPDGSIKYAENPPKKYQDIYPINFWPAKVVDRKALWDACLGILEHWIGLGVTVFRVDNPHTKPFAFWEWLIPQVRRQHPEAIFLAEAFTRPRLMEKLAEIGFTQSYSYFTWRTERHELEEYVEELARGRPADFMRPNFWPNTPDILSGPLRDGTPAAFKLRLVLAALLAPTYGIYSGYELCENEWVSEANEEYLHSEKYELRPRRWSDPNSLAPFIAAVNETRRQHPAFAELRTVRFHETNHPAVIAWSKTATGGTDTVLVIVNLDQHTAAETTLSLDLPVLGLAWDATFEVYDELTGDAYVWTGANPYVRLDPADRVAHVLAVRHR